MTPLPSSSKKRSLWPYAIIAVFVLFAGYIGYMVQQAMRTTVDLVSPDYYQQELVYQKRMENVARTAALPAPVELQYDATTHRLTLQLPANLAGQPIQGQLHFFRPSNQKLDFTLPAQGITEGVFFAELPRTALHHTNQKIRIGLFSGRVLIAETSTKFLGPAQ